jgi:hypothetical protein
MEVINKILTLANQCSARFLSLRFIDITGRLQQLDVIVTNLKITKDFVIVGNKKLKFIEDKYFFDPFRSHPTIFCLCEDLSNEFECRADVEDLIANSDIIPFPKTNHHHVALASGPLAKLCHRSYSSSALATCSSGSNLVLENGIINNISCECKIDFLVERQDKKHLLLDEDISLEPLDQLINLRSEIIDTIENIGIKTTYHCDGSKPSQCIIGVESDNILDMADNIIIIKYIIKNVAHSYGKHVIFTRDKGVPLSVYLNLSNYSKDVAVYFCASISKNLDKAKPLNNVIIGDCIAVKLNKDCNIIKLSIKTAEINPYKVLATLIQR